MRNVKKRMSEIIHANPELYKDAIIFSNEGGEVFTVGFIDIASKEITALFDKLNKEGQSETNQDIKDIIEKIDVLIYHLSVFTAQRMNEIKGG